MFKKTRLLFMLFVAFGNDAASEQLAEITTTAYGVLQNGEQVQQYTLSVGDLQVKAINYGAIITGMLVPDRHGKLADVVLGYDNLEDYEGRNRFFGAVVGRWAGRIANASFSLDGKAYQLSSNSGPHQLHGGSKGFDKVLWQAQTETTDNYAAVHFSYQSADGEEGFPGKLQVTVSYILNDRKELVVEYRAKTDKETVVNLTQHSYFNLAAQPGVDVLDHLLQVESNEILELDQQSIPTGQRLSVENTPFDFRHSRRVGDSIYAEHPQLLIGRGLDHYWIKDNHSPGELTPVAMLSEPRSGRKMTVLTTAPGLQIYSANYLNPTVIGKNGVPYKARYGICLETGQFTNAAAEPLFPLATVKPGQPWQSKTVFRFSTIAPEIQ